MSKLAPIVILAVFVVVLAAADTTTTITTTTVAPGDNSFEASDSSSSSTSMMASPTPDPHIKEDNETYHHKFAPYMGFMIAVLVLIFVVAGFIFYTKKQSEGEYNPMA